MIEAASRRNQLIAVLSFMCVAAVVAGCTKTAADLPKLGSIKGAVLDIFDSPPLSDKNPTAEAMYQDGLNYFEKERYARAIFYFQKVRDEFPFSPEAETAELKIAEAFYLNKDYAEATEAYKNYLAFQPTSEHAHFIKYQLGMVHYDQFSRVDRDQKNVKEAKRYFETLIKDHPESEHVPDAEEKLAKTREYLAEREFYIGQFYLKERKYLAARSRFENVLRDYMDTPTAVKALYMLGDAYRLEKNSVKATLAYEALIERYPDSAYADQARTYLASLKTEKYDPLASLLIQDGLPTSVGTPETRVADTGSSGGGRLQGQDQELGLVTKEGYEHEEITNKSLISSLNPFSSDSEKKDEATGGETEGEKATQESEQGFFSSLNPFSSSSDTAASDAEEAQTPGDTTAALVSSIDSNLEDRGVSGDTITQAPESELPEVAQEKEAPETDPAELLSNLDKGLTREGGTVDIPATPELHEVFAAPLPPQPTQEEKLAAVEKAKSTAETSTAGLLDSLDQTLEQKGIQQPDLKLPEEKPGETTPEIVEAAEQVELTPRLATTTETVELSPRLNSLGTEAKPLMLKEGEFALSRPAADAAEPAVSEPSQNEEENKTARALPDAVIKGVPEKPVPEVQTVSQTKPRAARADWDEEKNPIETMADQVDQAAQVLNPLSW